MKRLVSIFATALLLTGVALARMAGPSLTVSDRASNAFAVAVDAVTLDQDGFVVVHAVNPDGSLVITPELGKIYLPAGTYEGVLVDTLSYTQGPALRTRSQTLATGTVTIDTVAAAQDGFVVVHALDLEGDAVLTPPLGVANVEEGIHRFVTIELDADLLAEYGYEEGAKAIVPMLHVDDGNGTYEFPDGPDVPVTVDGSALVAPLELSMEMAGMPSIDVGSERLNVGADGVSVTLASVTLTQPGFVVLHAANEDGSLQVLPVLAVSPRLDAGTHTDVTLPMEMGNVPTVGDRVFAMLHVDDGDGVYRFPESDAPYLVDGAPFVVPFTLD